MGSWTRHLALLLVAAGAPSLLLLRALTILPGGAQAAPIRQPAAWSAYRAFAASAEGSAILLLDQGMTGAEEEEGRRRSEAAHPPVPWYTCVAPLTVPELVLGVHTRELR
jgi:hypothetical protein